MGKYSVATFWWSPFRPFSTSGLFIHIYHSNRCRMQHFTSYLHLCVQTIEAKLVSAALLCASFKFFPGYTCQSSPWQWSPRQSFDGKTTLRSCSWKHLWIAPTIASNSWIETVASVLSYWYGRQVHWSLHSVGRWCGAYHLYRFSTICHPFDSNRSIHFGRQDYTVK